jgi:hypothetical protein
MKLKEIPEALEMQFNHEEDNLLDALGIGDMDTLTPVVRKLHYASKLHMDKSELLEECFKGDGLFDEQEGKKAIIFLISVGIKGLENGLTS